MTRAADGALLTEGVLSPAARRALARAVEQLSSAAVRPDGLEIVVRVQHEGALTTLPAPGPVSSVVATEGAPVGPQADPLESPDGGLAAPCVAHPLAHRPIAAPAVLQSKLPFRRHIEESRPYVVLDEGVRMINAHPMAGTIFYGGLTYWVAGYVLARHGVRGAALAAVLVSLLLSWLTAYAARSGASRLLLASVRESRALLREPATWSRLDGAGQGWRLLARLSSVLLRVPRPDRALLHAATTVPQESSARGVPLEECG